MLGKELFKNSTGPCCAVLLLKVQATILAFWQLFCIQHQVFDHFCVLYVHHYELS